MAARSECGLLDRAIFNKRKEKSRTIFIVYYDVPLTLPSRRATFLFTQMIEGNASYRNHAMGASQPAGDDRLPLGSALLVIFGLSLLGWAVVVAPALAILYG